MTFSRKKYVQARDKRDLQANGVLLDLAEICQQKVNVYGTIKLMSLDVSQVKRRYIIKLCKTFGLTSFIPYVSSLKFD